MRPALLAPTLLLLLLVVAPAAAQQPRVTGTAEIETSASFGLRALEDADRVSTLGDVDGDGRRDAAIADEQAEVARIVLAGDGPVGLRGFRIRGAEAADLTDGVYDAGDLNGDGLADIAVTTDVPGDGVDILAIVFGRRDPRDVDLGRPEQRDVTLRGADDEPRAAAAGDVNGDGIGDLIVGSGDTGDEGRRSRAWIVFGARDLAGPRDLSRLGGGGITLLGPRGDSAFGFSVSGIGDADGDGLGDVVVGSPIEATDGEEDAFRGRGWIAYGRREAGELRVDGRGATALTSRRTQLLGLAAAGPGDVNGDGLGDLAIAAPSLPVVPLRGDPRSSISVVFGDRSRPAAVDLDALGQRGFTIQGRGSADGAGIDLAAPGDLDRDGRAELLVSEFGAPVSFVDDIEDAEVPGGVHVVYGSDSPAGVDLAAPGDRALRLRGSAVERAGVSAAGGSDLDADGRPEILVSRPGACRIGRLGEGDAVGIELGSPGPRPAGRGGPDPDALTGGPVGDALFGFDGADLLQGRDGHDCVSGGDGPDRLSGGLSGDAIFGEDGDDAIRGESGCDRIFGGPGADVIVAGPNRVPLVAAMRDPIGARDRDQVRGADGDDRISGGSDRDRLRGDVGDDRLDGGGDDDELDGGEGRDRLTGAAGRDALLGGAGADVLRGGAGSDVLDGDSDEFGGGDIFEGLAKPGADVLEGGSGDDLLFGGDGRDRLLGGAGRDRVDAIDGERDVVRCGPGRDRAFLDRFDRASGCEVVRRRRR